MVKTFWKSPNNLGQLTVRLPDYIGSVRWHYLLDNIPKWPDYLFGEIMQPSKSPLNETNKTTAKFIS